MSFLSHPVSVTFSMIRLHSTQEVHHQVPLHEAIFLVPTMGALHVGHEALIIKAKERAKERTEQFGGQSKVVVSIFVNPIQFDRAADLEDYPQPLEEDLKKCKALGVDYVFTPDSKEFYASDRSIKVSENALSALLCGATRPGHFDGVCTVISKLLNVFRPVGAIFGEKDYQQLAIIRRLARDLNFRTEVIGLPTVREPSGLALSSRNLRLNEETREQAPAIRTAMLAAYEKFSSGTTSADRLLAIIRMYLEKNAPLSTIDYLECVCAESLQAIREVDKPAVIAIASFFGDVRLIDNIQLHPSSI